MTQTILMLQGPPACGKTTLAEAMVAKAPGTWVRVNKDDIRAYLKQTLAIFWSPNNEKMYVVPERDHRIMSVLKAGKSVIVDDTNMAGDHEARLRALALWMNCRFELCRLDVSLEECVRRDAARPNSVGEAVVRKHYRDYERIVKATAPAFKPTPVEHVPGLPDAIICDLDGTLAERVDRGIYEFEKCADDALKPATWWVLKAMAALPIGIHPPQIIYMSGREEKYRPESDRFLAKHKAPFGPLYMRATGDNRNDAIAKAELFDQHIRGKYNVLFTLDDRDRVVQMWRDMGLTCLQVAPGNF